MSMLLGPVETALGSEVNTPPMDSHPPQVVPSQVRCQRPLSVPRTKASSRLAAHEEAAGVEVTTPPTSVHPAGMGGRMELLEETLNVHVYGTPLTVTATTY